MHSHRCSLVWIVFVLYQSASCVSHQANDTVRLVILIHRHGDRSPISFYPKDPYQDGKYWPDGLGELTIDGKERMYKVGMYLARRYNNFLTGSPREVEVRSSAMHRCLESASMVLAGLYPPAGRWKWNNSTDLGRIWQPFPIATVEFDNDNLLNPDATCKRAKQETANIFASPPVLAYKKTMQSSLDYVRANSGLNPLSITAAGEKVFDTLYIERLHSLPLPAWVDSSTYAALQDLAYHNFVFLGMTHAIQRLRAGSLLKLITERLLSPNLGKDNIRLLIYSTHDTLLSVFLQALDAYNNLPPPFGASILIEVRQNGSSEPYLKLLYLNVTETEKPYELSLPRCLSRSTNNQCTLTAWDDSVKDWIPGDWDAECREDAKSVGGFYFGGLLLLSLAILLLVSFYACRWSLASHNNRRRQNTFYKMLPVNC